MPTPTPTPKPRRGKRGNLIFTAAVPLALAGVVAAVSFGDASGGVIDLRSKDFFDVEQFPLIQYDVLSASRVASGIASIEGRLTVRGVTEFQPIIAKVTAVETDAVTLTTQFAVDRTAFGITWNQLGAMRGNATVSATLRFTRAGA